MEVHHFHVVVYYLPGYGNTNLENYMTNFGKIKWLHRRYFGKKYIEGH
jgi:hypothetical protein